MKKIGIIVGSLRKASWNRKIALVLQKIAPPSFSMNIVEIGQLPLYNQDLDDAPPKEWISFREQMKQVDALLFMTPEYNRSIPAPLKNAIDVGSRPYGHSIWEGKPAGIISVSPSTVGGFGANQHLRQTFVFLNVPCMQQPEAYIGQVDKLFDDNATLAKTTQDFLQKYMDQYIKWIQRVIK